MHLRLWRRFKIAPFTTLKNVTLRSISISFGVRGLRLTLNRHGRRITGGLSGTGLFLTDFRPYAKKSINKNASATGLIDRHLSQKTATLECSRDQNDC